MSRRFASMPLLCSLWATVILWGCGPKSGTSSSPFASSPKAEQATVEALFHPFDPTLEKVVSWIDAAQTTVDIAMYNMDTGASSPIVAYLASDSFKDKVQQGLRVRFLFEGYAGLEDATKRSQELEAYGIDVRWVTSSRKVHHKFAVIDAAGKYPRVISGSANWSMSSRRNYNENMVFVADSQEFAALYQDEFQKLWRASASFGVDLAFPTVELALSPAEDNGLNAAFNSANFVFNDQRVTIDRKQPGYHLTRTLEAAILKAKKSLRIATTRIQLRPLYEALAKVTQERRGDKGQRLPPVDVEIVVNMDQYEYASRRERMSLESCADFYDKACSTGKNFSYLLSTADFPGHEHVQVRVKYYNLRPESYLTKQMHSKYMIVDDTLIYTGSFNWSYSGEYDHFENLMMIDGSVYPEALHAYLQDHERVFTQGRDAYKPLVKRLEKALRDGGKTNCNFEPMALSYEEIDYLLDSAKRLQKPRLLEACTAP